MAIARLVVFSSIFSTVLGKVDHVHPLLLSLIQDGVGDPTDWVSVSYVVSKTQNSGRDSTTLEAEKTLVLLADKYAKGSPSSKYALSSTISWELTTDKTSSIRRASHRRVEIPMTT